MTDISRTRKHNSNPFQAIIRNSKTALLFLAVVLPNDSPRTMIVNRGTLSGIPNERDDGKGMIGGRRGRGFFEQRRFPVGVFSQAVPISSDSRL